jgi:hypothetical protein
MLGIASAFMWIYNVFARAGVRHRAALERCERKPAEGEVKITFNAN